MRAQEFRILLRPADVATLATWHRGLRVNSYEFGKFLAELVENACAEFRRSQQAQHQAQQNAPVLGRRVTVPKKGHVKLDTETVTRLLRLRTEQKVPVAELAKRFRIGPSTIRRAFARERHRSENGSEI
jgi:DNA invertase Pin-like site-specific DNA recombinase